MVGLLNKCPEQFFSKERISSIKVALGALGADIKDRFTSKSKRFLNLKEREGREILLSFKFIDFFLKILYNNYRKLRKEKKEKKEEETTMAWTLNQIQKELERISISQNDTFSIPVSLNGRLTKTLGRVVYKKNTLTGKCVLTKMEFSKNFMANGVDEEVKSVIAHEWAHYYVTKTREEDHDHDAVFMNCAESVGGHTGRYIKVSEGSNLYKYTVYCTKCGKVVGHCDRAGKTVKEPHLYKSSCCGASIRIEQNR